MFHKTYEERLAAWSSFRSTLETSKTPLEDVINFYRPIPTVSIFTDPWERETWPSPWELVYENQYCDFCRILGYCYTLQLTERFKDSKFEIHISTSQVLSYHYLLYVDQEIVLGYDGNKIVKASDLKELLEPQVVYQMPVLK
tara:strand:+ start:2456 stop:2881 length:426 start_codon:yes stop_codon:yes gene_type:complete